MKSSLLSWGSPDIQRLIWLWELLALQGLVFSPLVREHPGWETCWGAEGCGDTSTNTSLPMLAQQRPCQGAEGRRWAGSEQGGQGPCGRMLSHPSQAAEQSPWWQHRSPPLVVGQWQGDEPSPWSVQACKEQLGEQAHLGWVWDGKWYLGWSWNSYLMFVQILGLFAEAADSGHLPLRPQAPFTYYWSLNSKLGW